MISDQAIRVFFDGNTYNYIFENFTPAKPELYHSYNALSLNDSTIKVVELASGYSSEEGTSEYKDSEDNVIDEETFNNIADTTFEGQEEFECVLDWTEVSSSSDLTAELTESYNTFIGN